MQPLARMGGLLGGIKSGLKFVGATGGSCNVSATSYPAGASPGDLAIFHVGIYGDVSTRPVPDSLMTGWTQVAVMQTTNSGSGTAGSVVWSKILTSTDIASPPNPHPQSLQTGGWTMAVYQGVTSVVNLSASGTSTPRSNGATMTEHQLKTAAGKIWAIAAIDRDGQDNNLTNNTQGFVQQAKGPNDGGFQAWGVWWLDSTTWDGSSTISIGDFLGSSEEMMVLLEIR